MSVSQSFLHYMHPLEDYRVPGMVTYPLDEILLATLVGILCDGEDWDDVAYFAEEHMEWLRRWLPYADGVPSPRTFRDVFSALDSTAFAACFAAWVGSLTGHIRGVVAIDGKTARGSKRDASGKDALHVVSAFAHEAGLVLCQRRVRDKSNEITAIPELLEMLALEGAIVTIDAMGTQKDIAAKIVEKGADYVLALKGNQGNLHKDVRLFFEERSSEVAWNVHETTDGGHGRIDIRICTATDDIGWLLAFHPDWPGLRSIVRVEATRFDKKYKTESKETRYHISSLPPDAEELLAAIRAHWSVEMMHWSLDVTLREDANRTRKDHAAANLNIIRHAAFNLLKRNKDTLSLKRKRKKAAWNQDFLASLLTH